MLFQKYLIIEKAISEVSKIAPKLEADTKAKVKIAVTCPMTPNNAFLRPKLILLFAANKTEGPKLTDATTEILK